jgi:nitroreductase
MARSLMLGNQATDAAACGSATVDAAMRGRSVRAFAPMPVPQKTVAAILDVAACAPSGTNTQPWQVIALAGVAKQALCERVLRAYHREPGQLRPEYDVYPSQFVEPYLSRRRRNGFRTLRPARRRQG